MFKLEKQFRFEASHQLPLHDGKCARLHGHSWVGWLILEGPNLIREGPKTGMLIDYGEVGAIVKSLVDEFLDHRHLNDLMQNPTSEKIARWVYDQLKPNLPLLVAVRIEETCTSRAEYRPE